jgi:hypothetical protein
VEREGEILRKKSCCRVIRRLLRPILSENEKSRNVLADFVRLFRNNFTKKHLRCPLKFLRMIWFPHLAFFSFVKFWVERTLFFNCFLYLCIIWSPPTSFFSLSEYCRVFACAFSTLPIPFSDPHLFKIHHFSWFRSHCNLAFQFSILFSLSSYPSLSLSLTVCFFVMYVSVLLIFPPFVLWVF